MDHPIIYTWRYTRCHCLLPFKSNMGWQSCDFHVTHHSSGNSKRPFDSHASRTVQARNLTRWFVWQWGKSCWDWWHCIWKEGAWPKKTNNKKLNRMYSISIHSWELDCGNLITYSERSRGLFLIDFLAFASEIENISVLFMSLQELFWRWSKENTIQPTSSVLGDVGCYQNSTSWWFCWRTCLTYFERYELERLEVDDDVGQLLCNVLATACRLSSVQVAEPNGTGTPPETM